MLKRVLILSASAGAGHVRAAQAVEKAFLSSGTAEEVRNIDALEYTNKVFQSLYSKAYIEMVNKLPDIFGLFYKHFDKPWRNEQSRLAFDKLNSKPFVKMLREYQPDLTVCTHFLPAEIISWLKEENKTNTRQAIAVTDFDLHAFWLCHRFEHYFVAIEETKVHLERLGVPSDKITASGIPIDPVFSLSKDKKEIRQKLDLELDLPTILISAGGFGVGPVEQLIESLLGMRRKAQIIVVCGKNKDLKGKVDGLVKNPPAEAVARFHSVGYTDQMDSYMSASDLLLGKTGGLTTSEALAKGLGFVIVDPIPGQEQRNADHLLEWGAAIKCNNWLVLAYKIDKLLDDGESLARMQSNSRAMAKPFAARDIVEKLTRS